MGAMISGLIAEFEQALVAHMQKADYDRSPGAWLRAYIQANMDVSSGGTDQSVLLLAAVTTRSELLMPLREHFAAWQRRAVNDGIDPGLATVIRLAVDGLYLVELLNLAPPEGKPVNAW